MKYLYRLGISLVFSIQAFGVQGQLVDTLAIEREVDSLIRISRSFITSGRLEFDKALEINVVAEKLCIDKIGRLSASYGSACFNHGRTLHMRGDYMEAEKWYLESETVREKVLGKEHPDYALSLNNLGLLYKYMGDYNKSERFFIQTRTIREKVLGKMHPDYAMTINNLGILYFDLGNYAKSEPLYLEAKSIRSQTLGKEHADYAGSLNNLAILYDITSNYEKAEILYLEAIQIREKTVGKEHVNYAASLNNLASLYNSRENYDKAEPLFLKAKDIWEKALGKEHPKYAAALSNLAGLYQDIGNYAKAEVMFLEAIAIIGKTEGKENPRYAIGLANLGFLYLRMHRFEKVEPLFLEAKTIQEKTLGPHHPDYASSLNNLSIYYRDVGDFTKAESLSLQAKVIRERTFGKDHPSYAISMNNLTSLYWQSNNLEATRAYLLDSDERERNLLFNASRYLSERELSKFIPRFEVNLSRVYSYGQLYGDFSIICFNNTLFHKGFLLNSAAKIIKLSRADTAVVEKLNLLKSYYYRLAKINVAPTEERDTVLLKSLEEDADMLEKELSIKVKGYNDAMRQLKWQEIQQQLHTEEVAVEFVYYELFDKVETGIVQYAALLLQPGTLAPHFIPLFEEKQLAAPLEKTGNNAKASTQLYASRSGKVTAKAPAYGTDLYNLIWKPLDSLLQGVKTVYFSPSGLLHRVAFAALPIDGKKVLADRYALHQLGSTRSLVVTTPQAVAVNFTAEVFGGVAYDRKPVGTQIDSTATEVTDNRLWSYIERPRNSNDDGFEYLPGTAKEVRNLNADLRTKGIKVTTHTGAQATEEALKALGRDTVKSPDILHIATHGFFFPDPEKNKTQRFGDDNAFKWNENPLFRSGLALAGANQTWKGEPTPANLEDGIATAYEISHLNLSNTKLVVLSACETGLGDIKGSEGVYGLQRAFKMAGADYLLVSLWQVPDKETTEFMDVFYKTWLGGKTIHEAFAKAQKQMRKKYKEVYKWGAWVLVE